uniref:L-Fucosyltransferase n=2 Tax=Wuchereria bancrofti TaxID=6293 RepID=A0AAF5PW27_WUCBA
MQGCFATRNGLVVLTFAITLSLLVLLITNWSFYDIYVTDFNHLDRLSVVQVTRIFPQGGEDVKFDQPWTLPNIKIIENIDDINQSERYVISNFSWSPGLGNLMFQYASLRAIAERYNAKLIVPVKCTLRRGFKLDAIIVNNELNDELIRRYSSSKHHFAVKVDELFVDQNFEYISGYLQSYRYFHPQQEYLIHKQFTFLPEIIKLADDYLQKAKYEKLHARVTDMISANIDHRNYPDHVDITKDFYGHVYVGIHIRRGMDITMNSRNIKYGHTTITKDYIINAMNYFRSRFENLIFIISSDNEYWVKTNINHTHKGEIYIVSSGYREIDMATLVRCNHTIMSTGTFSWWTAYLTNGTTVYYNNWPKPNSVLERMIKKDEYFLNNWIPI